MDWTTASNDQHQPTLRTS